MSTINAYLGFDGQCEAAFKYYEKHLGGKIEYKMTWGESPMMSKDANPEFAKRLIHAAIQIGNQRVLGGDAPPDRFEKPQGFSMMLNFEDTQSAEKAFKALAVNGNVTMELQETFWAKAFAMVTDQFGIPWGINCPKPM